MLCYAVLCYAMLCAAGVLREQFKLVDTDGSGYIEAGELEDATKIWSANLGIAAPSVQAMLDLADTNRDGRISFGEFAGVMRRGA